jgi:hypothetical protein
VLASAGNGTGLGSERSSVGSVTSLALSRLIGTRAVTQTARLALLEYTTMLNKGDKVTLRDDEQDKQTVGTVVDFHPIGGTLVKWSDQFSSWHKDSELMRPGSSSGSSLPATNKMREAYLYAALATDADTMVARHYVAEKIRYAFAARVESDLSGRLDLERRRAYTKELARLTGAV